MRIILVSVFSVIILFAAQLFASDYPQSQVEREMDEMGSLLGGEGIIFRPGKERKCAKCRYSLRVVLDVIHHLNLSYER